MLDSTRSPNVPLLRSFGQGRLRRIEVAAAVIRSKLRAGTDAQRSENKGGKFLFRRMPI